MKDGKPEFSTELALALREGKADWQEHREEFLGVLAMALPRYGEQRAMTALRRIGVQRGAIFTLAQELCSDLYFDWVQKYDSREILDSWDGESPLPGGIMRQSFFDKRARSFLDGLNSRGRRVPLDLVHEEACQVDRGSDGGDETVVPLVDIRLSESSLAGNTVTKPLEMAGLQLFVRLDWKHPGHNRLKEKITDRVSEEKTWDGCRAIMNEKHEQASQRLSALIVGRTSQGDHRPGTKAAATKERVLEEYEFRRVFMPLDNNVVAELMACSVANAYQVRSRYRMALPELLKDHLESLGEEFVERFSDVLARFSENSAS